MSPWMFLVILAASLLASVSGARFPCAYPASLGASRRRPKLSPSFILRDFTVARLGSTPEKHFLFIKEMITAIRPECQILSAEHERLIKERFARASRPEVVASAERKMRTEFHFLSRI